MDFTELLEQHGVPYRTAQHHHHAREGWVQIDCPWCGAGSGKYHMGYALARGNMNCWRCGPQDVVAVLQQITNLSKRECIRWAKGARPQFVKVERKGRGVYKPPQGVGELSKAHRAYLQGRGFKPSEIERLWRIRGISLSTEMPWRIFIPIHQNGVPVSWTTRAIGDQAHRYYSADPEREAINHKTLLYGFDYVRHAVIVHEGPLDVWATGPGAAAVMGLAINPAQVALLAQCPRRVVCFDNQPDAQKRARRLVNDLSVFPGETLNVELDAKDAAEADRREIQKLRRMVFGKGDHV